MVDEVIAIDPYTAVMLGNVNRVKLLQRIDWIIENELLKRGVIYRGHPLLDEASARNMQAGSHAEYLLWRQFRDGLARSVKDLNRPSATFLFAHDVDAVAFKLSFG